MSKKTKPKTHVLFVLDKSSSMASTAKEAVQNYNEQVDQMKENSKEQDIRVSLVTFNSNVFEHIWDEPVEKLKNATLSDYRTGGMTAMRDGVGYGVQKLLETTDPEDENASYLVIIISDGYENDSKHYNPSKLNELIGGCRSTGRWTFTYMGCDEHYLREIHQQTGIPLANMAAWSNATGAQAKHAYAQNKIRTASYLRARSEGVKSSELYFSDQVGCSADYTDIDEGVDALNTTAGTPDVVTSQTPVQPEMEVKSTPEPEEPKFEFDLGKMMTGCPTYESPAYETDPKHVFQGHNVNFTSQPQNAELHTRNAPIVSTAPAGYFAGGNAVNMATSRTPRGKVGKKSK